MIRLAVALTLTLSIVVSAEPLVVKTVRVPEGGLQPQVVVDSAAGVVHLVYFKGDPAHGDLFYVRSVDDGATFSRPIRVNSQPGSAIAIGTIRGAQVGPGRAGRVHVAWNGSGVAEPKGPNKANPNPMLYARLNDAGDAFEPQRNVITQRYGLDGGGSVAADEKGNVYVAWHAPEHIGTGEANRRVWVAKSNDDGKTFAPETAASTDPTGACGCCGMKLFAHGNSVFALYRSATEMVHRDIYLLRSDDGGGRFVSERIAPMDVGMCIMSSAAFTASNDGGVLAAWETQGQVYWAKVDAHGAGVSRPAAATGGGKNRKYPALAVNDQGQVLMAWAEGTGWNKGGAVAWQVYDAKGNAVGGGSGRAEGLAAWSLPAAFAAKDGTFVVQY